MSTNKASEEIADSMLWALALTEDDKVEVTVFENRKSSTINLSKELAEQFGEGIIRHAREL